MFSKEEAKQLRKEFWTHFDRYSKRLPHLRQQNKKWILYNTGIKHLELKFKVERNLLRVMLEVNHRNENHRIDVYAQLDKYKTILEANFKDELIWDYVFTTETGKEVGRIYCERTDLDYYKKECWPEVFEYLSINMIHLEQGFSEIKDFIQPPEQM